MTTKNPDRLAYLRTMADELTSHAQNEEMIDTHYTETGQRCLAAAETLTTLASGGYARASHFAAALDLHAEIFGKEPRNG